MEGGCHCGAIRFKATKDPFWVGACYCLDCRKISGAPYTIFAGYDVYALQLLRGTPKNYSSSLKASRSFCVACSSPFSYSYKASPDRLFIPIGVFDDANIFKPEEHIWVSQKLACVAIDDDLEQRKE